MDIEFVARFAKGQTDLRIGWPFVVWWKLDLETVKRCNLSNVGPENVAVQKTIVSQVVYQLSQTVLA